MSQLSVLLILAWGFGLKAVRDLSAEFEPRARTWDAMTWAVGSGLAFELAKLGGGFWSGFALLAELLGIAAAGLFLAAMRSLQSDVCSQTTGLLPGGATGARAAGFALPAALILALGSLFPQRSASLARELRLLDGGVWLAASAWLFAGLWSGFCPRSAEHVYTPRALAVSFAFAFFHAALGTAARVWGLPVLGQGADLLGSLFVLTFVLTLYGMEIKIRSQKLAETRRGMEDLQAKFFEAEKLAAVGTVAAGASHDFNNTLTAILGRVALLLEEPGLSDAARRHLEAIRKAGVGAGVTTRSLLGLARRRSAGCPYASLREAVETPLDLLAKELSRNSIHVVKRIAEVPAGNLDLCLLNQACLNLYLNARDAMMSGKERVLTVALEARNGWAEISVSDTGAGIAESFRSKVFQSFQTTKGESGTGLGLYASRAAVTGMGGRMSFETEEGRGTAFKIEVPIGPESDGAKDAVRMLGLGKPR